MTAKSEYVCVTTFFGKTLWQPRPLSVDQKIQGIDPDSKRRVTDTVTDEGGILRSTPNYNELISKERLPQFPPLVVPGTLGVVRKRILPQS